MTTCVTPVRWGDIDANGHARNTAYSEYATDARFTHLAGHGFTLGRLHELRLGLVLFSEQLSYRRELRLGDTVTVTVELAALSSAGHRWALHHRLSRDGALAATVQVAGAFIGLDTRALIAPPPELLAALATLPRTEDFTVLPDPGTSGARR